LNLLVGATGFVGGHVVEYLFQQGEISKGIFRKGSHLKIMDSCGVQGIEADLLDHHSLHEAMEGVDAVYNMASPMPGADEDFLRPNTEGILNLLEVASESKVKTFVHLSTIDVYGFGAKRVTPSSPLAPSNPYQKSKAEAERLLHEFSKRNLEPRVNIIRPAKAVGPRDESMALPILRMADSGRVVVPSGGIMSFSHPRDIAQAMFKATMGNSPTGSVYLMKSFDSTPEDFARGMVSSMGKNAEVRKQGLLSGSAIPRYTADQLRASVRMDQDLGWKELGYAPEYDLKRTCEEIATWYKKEPWLAESA
jgi:nucleoside-diphosphate-sugar epimerase